MIICLIDLKCHQITSFGQRIYRHRREAANPPV